MVSGAVSAGGVSPGAGAAPETDQAAEARAAMWVGVHVSAARCLLTYVLAPLAGGLGGILGPVGLLVQVLGTVTAIAGARRLWQMQHRGRYAYCAVAIALTLVTAAATSEHLLEGRT